MRQVRKFYTTFLYAFVAGVGLTFFVNYLLLNQAIGVNRADASWSLGIFILFATVILPLFISSLFILISRYRKLILMPWYLLDLAMITFYTPVMFLAIATWANFTKNSKIEITLRLDTDFVAYSIIQYLMIGSIMYLINNYVVRKQNKV